MVRALIIISTSLFLLFGCTEEPRFELYSVDSIYQKMSVEFTIEIIDRDAGMIRLIDHSSGVDELLWECRSSKSIIEIPNTYPGDTVEFQVFEPGTYVVELTGIAVALKTHEDGYEESVYVKKTRVQSFEISELVLEEPLQPYLNYVVINSFPQFDEYALEWDADGSGPDVNIEIYYELHDDYVNESLTGVVYDNLTTAQLPITETVNYDFSMLDITINLVMQDFDLPNENRFLKERMVTESFYFYWDDSPDEPIIQEYTDKHFTIGVEWK